MREPRGKLLHLANCVWQLLLDEHLEVGANHLIAIGLGWFLITTVCGVLLDLAEDPGIRRRRSSDHYRIAASLRDDGASVFGRADVAVSDHRNLNRLLDSSDPFPARLAAV